MTDAQGPRALGDPSVQAVGQVLQALAADADRGLTTQEAARRLVEHGRNELRGVPAVATWRRLLAQFQDPLMYLLLAAIGTARLSLGQWLSCVAMVSVVLWYSELRKWVSRSLHPDPVLVKQCIA